MNETKTSPEPSAVGVFDNLDNAKRSLEELRRAGFPSDEIGIIGHVGQDMPTPPEMQVPEDNAVAGLVEGGILGAIVGAIVVIVIPGLGAVAGMGFWFEIVGGAALGAVIAGVLVAFGSFVFLRSRTRYYAAALEKGNFIVTVKSPTRKDEAVSVLRRNGILAEQQPDAGS